MKPKREKPGPEGSTPEREKRERQDWLIVLLILLLGFCCVCAAGQWALRFSPTWKLNANVDSHIDLNSEFLTSRPVGFFEPLDPAILTKPGWANGFPFLTPGIPLAAGTGTPLAIVSTDLVPTNVTPTMMTGTPVTVTPLTVSPTNTLYVPPVVITTKPGGPGPGITPTNTSPPPTPSADLRITKTSATGTYAAGSTITYTVTVVNNGPSAVTGTTVVDMIPSQVINWDWVCTSQTGGASGCNAVTNSTLNFTDTVNLPNGASIVYTVTARTAPAASANLTNLISINVPGGYNDPATGNNQSSYTHTLTVVPLNADLGITKISATNTYAAGNTVSYTVTVVNNGPSAVTGAIVSDTLPAAPSQVTSWDWVCAAQNGGANGCNGILNSSANFSDTVNLPMGASIVYTVTARTSPAATANLTNIARVAVPGGYIDSNGGNDQSSYTHTFTVVPINTDLQITKGSATNTYFAGDTITYTVTVVNNGPSAVTGAIVSDNIPVAPSQILNWDWSCVEFGGASACNGITNSNGNFSDTVNLPVGASIVYTVTARTSPSATANLTNIASVAVPAGYIDGTPGNDQSPWTHTFAIPAIDVRITKTSATGTYSAGDTITYTVTVVNDGPNAVTGAVVSDSIPVAPSQVVSWDWACTSQNNGANGCSAVTNSSANFTDTVNLPNGASIVYTVTARTSPTATANLTNIASVAVPGGYNDTNAGNNQSSYTHTFTVVLLNADLGITKTSATGTYSAGDTITYTVTVVNSGPSAVTGAVVTDNIPVAPSQVVSWDWACTAQNNGATGCDIVTNSSANFSDTVNLPVGASIVYTVTARTSPTATANLTNTASVAVPGGYNDTNAGNNQSPYTHTLTVVLPVDLRITKTSATGTYTAGSTITYTVTVENIGVNAVTNAVVIDDRPSQVTSWTWGCIAQTNGANGCDNLTGSGNFNDPVNLPSGATIVYSVTAVTSAGATTDLTNTASVSVPGGYNDTDPLNNQSSYTHTLVVAPPSADLRITKDDGETIYPTNGTLTYTITVRNFGPDAVTGAHVTDSFDTSLSNITWTCTGTACSAASGTGNIDQILGNLPNGASVTYSVSVTTGVSIFSTLSNTAYVDPPAGVTDPASGNNNFTDNDAPQMDTSRDCATGEFDCCYFLTDLSSLVLNLSVEADGDVGTPDLVYWERPSFAGRIQMDWVIISVSMDGSTWIPVLNWGDGNPDSNTNIDIDVIGGSESDERQISRAGLYPPGGTGTGITIDIDAVPGITPGATYPYIQIYAPAGGADGGIYIDGMGLYP